MVSGNWAYLRSHKFWEVFETFRWYLYSETAFILAAHLLLETLAFSGYLTLSYIFGYWVSLNFVCLPRKEEKVLILVPVKTEEKGRVSFEYCVLCWFGFWGKKKRENFGLKLTDAGVEKEMNREVLN